VASTNSYWGDTAWCLRAKIKVDNNSDARAVFAAFTDGTNRIYFEFGTPDAQHLYCITEDAGSETSEDLGVVDLTTYKELRIDRLSGSKVNFYVDGILEISITTNVPTTAMSYLLQISTSSNQQRTMYVRPVVAMELKQ